MNNPTHQVVITISSKDDSAEANVQFMWNPLLDTDEVEALGYTPSSYLLAESINEFIQHLLAMETLLEIEDSDMSDDRVVH